jgi:hypothetical protein
VNALTDIFFIIPCSKLRSFKHDATTRSLKKKFWNYVEDSMVEVTGLLIPHLMKGFVAYGFQMDLAGLVTIFVMMTTGW